MKSRQVKELEQLLSFAVEQRLMPAEVYDGLASYGLKTGEMQVDRRWQMTGCTDYAIGLTEKYKEKYPQMDVLVQNQNQSFRHVCVQFDSSQDRGIRDMIKLYIPISSENILYTTRLIYDFMFEQGINFQSKVAGYERNEMFVVRVGTKEEAQKVIDFCSSTPAIVEAYREVNPLLAQVNRIGIAKDTLGESYNYYMAELVSTYARSTNVKSNHLKHFAEFVMRNVELEQDSKRRHLANVAALEINAIVNGENILDSFEDEYQYGYSPSFFGAFSRYKDDEGCYYYADEKGFINVDADYELWTSLNAQNCMHKMFMERTGDRPHSGFQFSKEETYKISRLLDFLLDSKYDVEARKSMFTEFESPEVLMLLPYLYADFARIYKGVQGDELRNIVYKVRGMLNEEPVRR